jgi:hypothetical protein
MRLLLASIVATLGATVTITGTGAVTVGCGGRTDALLPDGVQPQDSGGPSNDGGPTDDVIVSVDVYVPTFDAQPPPEDAPVIATDTTSCLAVGEACGSNVECCTFLCIASACQPVTPPPSCVGPGDACESNVPCCSGACDGGVCGESVEDAGVSCSQPTGNGCAECLAETCCPQLAACESDSLCTQALNCFEACFTGSNGAQCSSQCDSEFPSPLADALASCGASQCASTCE